MIGSIKGFRAEPVVVSSLITAVLITLVEFGVPITPGQQTAVQGLIAAAFAVFLRSQVTSETTLRKAGSSGEQVTTLADPLVKARLVVDGSDTHKVPPAPMDKTPMDDAGKD